jgi:hypothetical protein
MKQEVVQFACQKTVAELHFPAPDFKPFRVFSENGKPGPEHANSSKFVLGL